MEEMQIVDTNLAIFLEDFLDDTVILLNITKVIAAHF